LAQLTSAQRRVSQAQANLARLDNVLARFEVIAPLDGVVTNLPVRLGETVVQGVQNSAASTILTIADMSLITAEVDVDETDIVNVQLGQTAAVTIEAIPNKTFTGRVTRSATPPCDPPAWRLRRAPPPRRRPRISRSW
jgi:HlyD family secretion protein